MDLLSFRLPEQKPPGLDAFDTRPAEVQRWVDELPMGHIGGAAKQLYEMFHEVNRLDIPLTHRFELMELTRAPLHTVLEALERHYTSLPFPLPNKSLRVAQVSTGILQEVVVAYQAVLNGEENASWLFRKTHTRMWLETVHRLIYYLHRILHTYQLLHRTAPPGIWQAMHALYWTARDHHREHDKVKAPLSGEITSIEGEYIKALLLSMLEPHLFNREQMAEVRANMRLWVQLCEMVEMRPEDEEIPGYCVRREADSPYTLYAERCCSEGENRAIVLEMGSLVLRIAGLLEQLDGSERTQLKGGGEISRETLEILQECWRIHDGGREERAREDREAEVAISMSGIFRLLQSSLDATARGISDQHMSDELEELSLEVEIDEKERHNHGTIVGSRSDDDVWQSVFYATEFVQKSWSRDVDEQEYRFVPARQRNYTESGFFLEFNRDEVEPFQVGELMGVKTSDDETMQLCMVRWLTDSSRKLSAGLMRLAESVEPALIIAHQEEHRIALYCLLGIGMDQRPQLFLPHLPGIRKKQLFLVVDGKEVPVTLHDRVVVSPLFDAFHFHAVSVDADEEMSLPQMNRQLHYLVHPERAEEELREREDFSDLWNSL